MNKEVFVQQHPEIMCGTILLGKWYVNSLLQKGSSKAMEGHGMTLALQILKDDEFYLAYFILDGDASSRKTMEVCNWALRGWNHWKFICFLKTLTKILQMIFPNAKSLRCIKHVARNMRKALQRLQNIRGFAKNERELLKKTSGHLGIDWVNE